jgi:hypothetical protein
VNLYSVNTTVSLPLTDSPRQVSQKKVPGCFGGFNANDGNVPRLSPDF